MSPLNWYLNWYIMVSTRYDAELWYGVTQPSCCPLAITRVGSVRRNLSYCTQFLSNHSGIIKKGRDYDSI